MCKRKDDNKINKRVIFNDNEIKIIIDMYINKLMPPIKIGKYFNCGERPIIRELINHNVTIRNKANKIIKYTFNKNYFDIIDSEERAYWIGFIWCDGYVCRRERNNNINYEFKLALSEKDKEHLEKLKIHLNSNHPIKIYKNNCKSTFESQYDEARLFISNKYFGGILYNEYEMIPNRTNCDRLISKIPNELKRHFIRGIIDAEGSIIHSWVHDRNYNSYKNAVCISTYVTLLNHIQDFLYNNNIINAKSKLYKRHLDRDGECVTVKYCGNINSLRLLNYIYNDATVYLQRKYDKYIEIKCYEK